LLVPGIIHQVPFYFRRLFALVVASNSFSASRKVKPSRLGGSRLPSCDALPCDTQGVGKLLLRHLQHQADPFHVFGCHIETVTDVTDCPSMGVALKMRNFFLARLLAVVRDPASADIQTHKSVQRGGVS
jgi:hypothetical protein